MGDLSSWDVEGDEEDEEDDSVVWVVASTSSCDCNCDCGVGSCCSCCSCSCRRCSGEYDKVLLNMLFSLVLSLDCVKKLCDLEGLCIKLMDSGVGEEGEASELPLGEVDS